MPWPLVPRLEAIRILETDRDAVMELIAHLPARAITTRGLGGGDWSPKDLLGHVESWEEYALESMEAWSRTRKPPLEVAFKTRTLDQINEEAVVRKVGRRLGRILAGVSSPFTHDAAHLPDLRAFVDERGR